MGKDTPDLALYRLEDQDWIKAEWGISENNRKARARLSSAINLVMKGA